ncbi:hypothetical protein PVAP13_6KG356512 [Panicum virgatum]|uniref:Trichome birefringence-like N-terminal domain-containing protein n=1 Tax=Panicum virgatum TaxID=38727 RepID=A0A8T0RG90_PANVG|nr:hypothetical protein PVAP13_6KG356512 [Panicum virgatum]
MGTGEEGKTRTRSTRLWAGVVSIAAEAAQTRRKVAAAGNEDECDLFDGEWVRPDGGDPLYDSRDCPFLYVGSCCSENGCPDASYTKWRWQPARCDLPRFVVDRRSSTCRMVGEMGTATSVVRVRGDYALTQ